MDDQRTQIQCKISSLEQQPALKEEHWKQDKVTGREKVKNYENQFKHKRLMMIQTKIYEES